MSHSAQKQEPTKQSFRRAVMNGVELDYEVRGNGEPVVLVHAGVFADWFKPLLDEGTLTSRYRVVNYHRVGYAKSTRLSGAVSIAQQAVHLRALLNHLQIKRAHIVGHSSGANIALQLALDAPEMVQSLGLLEPALPMSPSGPDRLLSTRPALSPAIEYFRAGDKERAIDTFMRGVSGPDYRAPLERAIPGAFEQAIVDAETFFGQELPAVQSWTFQRHDATRISQPVLAVVGEKSKDVSSIWTERQQRLLTWLPRAEPFVLKGATHLLHVQNPRGMADGLIAFFDRHSLSKN
jgi:pimeloyl-ACP methyl ester carboxylesterase